MKLRHLLLGRKAMTKLDSILKSRAITLPTNVCLVKAMVFPVFIYECEQLDHKEGWVPKNWCFLIVVLKKILESPVVCNETKPVNPKGNQLWIFPGVVDAKAEAPISWPPDSKCRLTGKYPDTGKDRRQKEKRVTEDEMVRWHHQLSGHEFEETLGDSEGQGSLVCCNTWGLKESDMT